ncbi:MAG: putative zinc-binding peptidase [Rhizobiaceae bacterium]|nr:putative zinc-binding peptidase [Rhizobiaceae bacterium]
MRLFQCQNCGNVVYFSNSTCVHCGHRLGYLPSSFDMSALSPEGDRWAALADQGRPYLFCHNADMDVCNWLVEDDHPSGMCIACRHNRTIPDLSVPGNPSNWAKLEAAKRHLFYSLMQWKLPITDRSEDPDGGLVFDFVADGTNPDGTAFAPLTGHADGVITMNIAEADDAEREFRRTQMGEPYRTLLGHFRHEIAHYYWDRLVRDGGRIQACRDVFGDESEDYAQALRRHYDTGPLPGWEINFISAYSVAHPWEDFAETWAHYMHIVDAIETARAFGISIGPRVAASKTLSTDLDFDPYRAESIEQLVDAIVPVTVAMNSINRSLGQKDFYPFVLSDPVIAKLRFIHQLISDVRDSRS